MNFKFLKADVMYSGLFVFQDETHKLQERRKLLRRSLNRSNNQVLVSLEPNYHAKIRDEK